MCVEAVETSFARLDEILPDSLILTDELNGFNHYSSCESFDNLAYGLNPVLDAALKADTTQKYNFQYVAVVYHLGPGEFNVRTILVDSVWKAYNFDEDTKPFFQDPVDN